MASYIISSGAFFIQRPQRLGNYGTTADGESIWDSTSRKPAASFIRDESESKQVGMRLPRLCGLEVDSWAGTLQPHEYPIAGGSLSAVSRPNPTHYKISFASVFRVKKPDAPPCKAWLHRGTRWADQAAVKWGNGVRRRS